MQQGNNYIIKKLYNSFIIVSVMSALIATVGIIIDNIIVGQFLGSDCLAAMGITNPVGIIFATFGTVYSNGSTTIIAKELGRGNRQKVNSVFTISILFTIITGMILMLAVYCFAPQISVILGAKAEILEPTIAYLRGLALGTIPIILLPNLTALVKIDGSNNLPIIIIFIMTILDIILDVLAAVVFKTGMLGIALATSISYLIAVIITCIHFKREYNTFKLVNPIDSFEEVREIIEIGGAPAVQKVGDTIKLIIFNHLVVIAAGTGAVVALNVRQQVYNLLGSLILGAGQALMPIAAMFYGEEDEKSLNMSIRESIFTGLKMCIPMMIILLIFPEVFSQLLGVKDQEINRMAVIGIRLFAISMPIRLLVIIWSTYYQIAEHVIFAIVTRVLQSFVFAVISALILFRFIGVNGVFLSYLIAEILSLAVIYAYAAINNKAFSISIKGCTLLSEDFGKDIIKKWEISIENDIHEVISMSEKIVLGFDVNADSKKTINIIAMTIEEIAGTVIRHAFKPEEKRWIDVLIFDKKDKYVIRLRDNGNAFNPIKYKDENTDAQNGHVGIKLIADLSADISYNRSLGLNNLVISINK